MFVESKVKMDFRNWVWSENDAERLRAAFRERFGEEPPRTETLFAVAAEGIRINAERSAKAALAEIEARLPPNPE